jgi:hypothetical protein
LRWFDSSGHAALDRMFRSQSDRPSLYPKEREVNVNERTESMNRAIAWFGVEPTPAIIGLIATINLYHHDQVMSSREIKPLRAICGEPAIFATVEEDQ